jgi:hypothetical protein
MTTHDAHQVADRALSDAIRQKLQKPGLSQVDRLALFLADPYAHEQRGYARVMELLDSARQRKAILDDPSLVGTPDYERVCRELGRTIHDDD